MYPCCDEKNPLFFGCSGMDMLCRLRMFISLCRTVVIILLNWFNFMIALVSISLSFAILRDKMRTAD